MSPFLPSVVLNVCQWNWFSCNYSLSAFHFSRYMNFDRYSTPLLHFQCFILLFLSTQYSTRAFLIIWVNLIRLLMFSTLSASVTIILIQLLSSLSYCPFLFLQNCCHPNPSAIKWKDGNIFNGPSQVNDTFHSFYSELYSLEVSQNQDACDNFF